MAEEFVKKEVFDARMDRMEALLEKAVFEMKTDNAQLRNELGASMSKMQAENEKLRSDVNASMNKMQTENEKLRGDVNTSMRKMQAEIKESIAGLDRKIDAVASEMRESNAQIRGEIRVLDSRIDSVNARIEGLQTTVYWGFAIVAIVIALLPTIQSWRKIFHRPAVTMEDVERAVNAAIQQARLESK